MQPESVRQRWVTFEHQHKRKSRMLHTSDHQVTSLTLDFGYRTNSQINSSPGHNRRDIPYRAQKREGLAFVLLRATVADIFVCHRALESLLEDGAYSDS